MGYLKLFQSLPNFNFNKEIVQDDFYNPTLYKWDGYWVVSWVSDEGDSLLDFVGSTPEESIDKAIEYIKEHYQVSVEEKSQPLFTLTADELEVVRAALSSTKYMLEKAEPTIERDIAIEDINSILNRIKDYKNGK